MVEMTKPNTAKSLDPEVSMIAHVTLKPGMETVFEEFMAVALDKNRAEAGNISFTLFRVDGETGRYYMVERWKNQAALDLHLQQDHFKDTFDMLEKTLSYPLSDVAKHIEFVDELSPAHASRATGGTSGPSI